MQGRGPVPPGPGPPLGAPFGIGPAGGVPDALPPTAAQQIAETFVRQYYGLLAVRPSAVVQFYNEDSHVTRSFHSQLSQMPSQSLTDMGTSQIMDSIMTSVGGQDPVMGKPTVCTHIVSLNAVELADKDKSGYMIHITGIIWFTEESLVRRFSRTVFLEPCRKTQEVLYVRNDIVHYSEFDVMPQPGIPMQPAMPGMQPGGMYPQAQLPVCPGPRPTAPGAMSPAAGQMGLPGAIRVNDLGAPTPVASMPSAGMTGVGAPQLPPLHQTGPMPGVDYNHLGGDPSLLSAAAVPVAMASGIVSAAAPASPPANASTPYAVAATVAGSQDALPTQGAELAVSSAAAAPNQQSDPPAPASPQAKITPPSSPGEDASTPPPASGTEEFPTCSSPVATAATAAPMSPVASPSGGAMSWAERAALASKGAAAATSSTPKPAANPKRSPILPTTSKAPPPSSPVSSPKASTNGASGEAAPASPSSAAGASSAGADGSRRGQGGNASASSKSPVAGEGKSPTNVDSYVKLWVNGIPTEMDTHRGSRGFQPVRSQEVKDVLNQSLKEHVPNIGGEVAEVDRKDDRKPFAFALLTNEVTARELVRISKERKVILRGERLILDLSNYNTTPMNASIHSNPSRSQWHDDNKGERSERKGKGGAKGEKGEKGDSGWGRGSGKGWRGQR